MSLIKQAQQTLLEDRVTLTNITSFAKSIESTVDSLHESVTHVLAGLGQTSANMDPRTVASFLAGIEKIAKVLPTATANPNQQQNTIRLLTAAAMKFDDLTKKSLPNSAVVKIAQYGAGDAELMKKYLGIVQQGSEQITTAANQLRTVIDRVITTSNQPPQNQQQSIPPQQSGQQSQQGPQSVLKLQPQGQQSAASTPRPAL